jgi:hypothetical protein
LNTTIVDGNFNCSYNELKTLEYGPTHVGKGYFCDMNALTSLRGCPQHIHGDFSCNCNELRTLVHNGMPKIIEGNFECLDNAVDFDKNYIRNICNVKGNIEV